MTHNILGDLFLIFVGARACIPLQFERWERWPGGAMIVIGCIALIVHAASALD